MANLLKYEDGSYLREATADEIAASLTAANTDGGAGAITVDGATCYVDGARCSSCEDVGEISQATATRNGKPVCADCATDIDSRCGRIGHFCDECDEEIEGDYCEQHPNATVSSILVRGDVA